ncbi:MAG: DNA primase [Legionellaceae bacterium]|nr:DNA primase [Legionellaceae bacterium]
MQGLIQQTFIDELLARTDIVEFIDGYVPLKKRGNSFIACCPFHNEKSPSFNVTYKKQFYHCFGCNASGNAISFAMNYLHQSFPDAVETIAAKAGMQVVYEKSSNSKTNNNLSLHQLLDKVAQFYQQTLKSSSGKIAVNYLKNRGLSGEIAKQYQIGYAPEGWQTLENKFRENCPELLATGMLIKKDSGKTYDRYRHRVMFPIHDRHGKIIGFGGRALDNEQKPKYLNSPETTLFQKSRELYGLYQIIKQNTSNERILIVEGYMDVLALAQHGIGNVAASLGTATSSYHIQLLMKHTKEIVFCFDGDSAGRQAAWRALESTLAHLDSDLSAKFVFLPENDDPDSIIRNEGKEAFLKRIESAISLNKFFFDSLLQDIDISIFSGKSKLIMKAKPFLLKMADGPYKQLLINELSQLTRIENHRILQLISEKDSPIEKSNQESNHASRSPMRIAIAILLQNPEIYSENDSLARAIESFETKPRVLSQLMRQIADNPTITTAGLVELWRPTPLFNIINELAGYSHKVPESALANELVETILFIKKQSHENKIQQLIEKSRKVSLTESERNELQILLKKRHNLTQDK